MMMRLLSKNAGNNTTLMALLGIKIAREALSRSRIPALAISAAPVAEAGIPNAALLEG